MHDTDRRDEIARLGLRLIEVLVKRYERMYVFRLWIDDLKSSANYRIAKKMDFILASDEPERYLTRLIINAFLMKIDFIMRGKKVRMEHTQISQLMMPGAGHWDKPFFSDWPSPEQAAIDGEEYLARQEKAKKRRGNRDGSRPRIHQEEAIRILGLINANAGKSLNKIAAIVNKETDRGFCGGTILRFKKTWSHLACSNATNPCNTIST